MIKHLFTLLIISILVVSCGTENNSDNEARDKTTQVVKVQNPITGRIWMDRNLGASRAATSSTDAQAYGDLYQWGRAADGHEKRNSPTTSSLSGSDQPSHGSFILSSNSLSDWRSPQNDNLWQGVNGVNNPCLIDDINNSFQRQLKFPLVVETPKLHPIHLLKGEWDGQRQPSKEVIYAR